MKPLHCRGTRSKSTAERLGRRAASALATLLMIVVIAGCDSLLEVTLPGQLEEPDLDDPALAATLSLGAQGDFECALSAWAWQDALWVQELHSTDIIRTRNLVAARLPEVRFLVGTDATFAQLGCTSENPPPMWYPFHGSRFVAEDAASRIQGWQDDGIDIPDADFLTGQALAYAGYSTQLLSEGFCEVAFDLGPVQSREEGMQRALDRFQTALGHLNQVTGASADRAQELIHMVHVGMARAHLNLGNDSEVLNYAGQVPEGFVEYAGRSSSEARRWNRVYNLTRPESQAISVGEENLEIEVDGVPDPRIQAVHTGLGSDGFSEHYQPLKYQSRGDDIPFASWREAQLMIAEVEGGQTAVDVINALRATYDLPEFSSSDEAEIRETLIEERRRELWLTGTHLADILRLDLPLQTSGTTRQGEPFGDLTCMPIPELEVLGNPNL